MAIDVTSLNSSRQQGHGQRTGKTRAMQYYQAAIERWRDAEELQKNGRYQASIYLGGYVIEFNLKYIICIKNDIIYIEDLESRIDSQERENNRRISRGKTGHNLEFLVRTAKIEAQIYSEPLLHKSFVIVNNWDVAMRYSPHPETRDYADRFLSAVEVLKAWLLAQAY